MVPRPVPPSSAEPLIPRFYAGRELLITGGTGFMGKVLVERVLSTCPHVARLHLLLRDKRGHTPQKRLAQLKQTQIFDSIRERCPEQLEKLSVVAGDVAKPNLGLENDALAQLSEVSVVFHSAATIKFDEPLGVAVDQNVRSVERVMDLCDALPNVEAFVHVSTAYSNADQSYVEERVYPVRVTPAQVYALVDSVPEQLLTKITNEYISPKPNTYTFTKALAENVIETRANRAYPVAIFRPTIVIASLRSPYPGWLENLNGPSGVLVAAGKGLLHVFCCRARSCADMLPVDIAIDTLLAAAWEVATDRPQQARVYNCSTSANPTSWGAFDDALRTNLRAHPLDNTYWYPSGYLVQNKYSHKALEILLQTVPLHLAEYVARILGIKTKLSFITVSNRLTAMSEVLRFFATREWKFATDNVQRLHARLTPQDAAIYNLDPHSIDWDEMYKNFAMGTRKFLLQEKEQDMEKAKTHLRRMYYLHYGVGFFVLTLLIRFALHNPYIQAFVHGIIRMLISLISKAFVNIKRVK